MRNFPLQITVVDENDNAPRFHRILQATIQETAAIGSMVIQVTCSDEDLNYNHSFLLSPNGQFRIDSSTGEIFLTSGLDRELVNNPLNKHL